MKKIIVKIDSKNNFNNFIDLCKWFFIKKCKRKKDEKRI